MSRLSQFYSGSTSGFIDVEIFLVAGGGGGGVNGPGGSPQGFYAGSGGGGAVYYGVVSLAPGTKCYIQVGAGGQGNDKWDTTVGTFHGFNGGTTAFRTPTTVYRVIGGGGGGGSFAVGTKGGCGGGDHGSRPLMNPTSSGLPSEGVSAPEARAGGSFYDWSGNQNGYNQIIIAGNALPLKGGMLCGYGGGGAYSGAYNHQGGGGAGGGPYGQYGGFGVYTHLEGHQSSRSYVYGQGGSGGLSQDGLANRGQGGSSSSWTYYYASGKGRGYNGGSGVVMVNYPNAFSSATITGSGNGAISFGSPSSDFTNGTFGVRGYKFVSSGSITLP